MEQTEEAPPVVAVVVTRDPGPWFEATLDALGAQDYPSLSVLVIDAAGTEEVTPRVAATLPGAFVRRLPADPGYAAAANEAVNIVQGAQFFVFLHDDAAPEPDAIRHMVAEAFRNNAGVVTPKIVRWDDPDRLLSVGEGTDRTGREIALVEAGELDQGQHDGSREVFCAPGACMLVRADLFNSLRGFDADLVLGGEDLDLSWRARRAGARVLTAPRARVAHLSALDVGERTSHLGDHRLLEERGRLRAAVANVGPMAGLRTLLTVAVVVFVEAVVAIFARRKSQASRSFAAMAWNLNPLSVGTSRRRRPSKSAEGAKSVASTLNRGGAFTAAAERVLASDSSGKRNLTELRRDLAAWWRQSRIGVAALAAVALVLLVGSRDLLGQPLPELGSMSRPDSSPLAFLRSYVSGWRHAGLGGAGPNPPAFVVLGIAGIVFFGKTGLMWATMVFGSALVGIWGAVRLARRIGSPRATLSATVIYALVPLAVNSLATGRLGGLVAYAAAPFILARLLYMTGLEPFGRQALAEQGGRQSGRDVTGEIRRPGSAAQAPVFKDRREEEAERARAEAPAMAEQRDQHGNLILDPSMIQRSDDLIFDDDPGTGPIDLLSPEGLAEPRANKTVDHSFDELGDFDDMAGLGDLTRRRRAREAEAEPYRLNPPSVSLRPALAQAASLGLLVAVAGALAPALLPVTALVALSLLPSAVFSGDRWSVMRGTARGLISVLVAFLLLAPWTLWVLGSWRAFVGQPSAPWFAPSFLEILRFETGPVWTGPFGYGLLVAALLPLLIGGRWRLSWAARLWFMALLLIFVAWVGPRGWLGSAYMDPSVLLPFAAVALAMCIALGVAAFQVDLRGYRFGWRQGASVLAGVAVLATCVPMFLGALNGRWGAPLRSHTQATTWMRDEVDRGNFRVLWLGAADALPAQGWDLSDGVSFAISRNGPPTARDQWAGPRDKVDDPVADAVMMAWQNRTTTAGRLLAPTGVRYIVVVTGATPPGQDQVAKAQEAGVPSATRPVPQSLTFGLRTQSDLQQRNADPSMVVLENTAWVPSPAQLGPEAKVGDPAARDARSANLSGASPALVGETPDGTTFSGHVRGGRVLLAEAPDERWVLTENGSAVHRVSAYGVANLFDVTEGEASLRYNRPWWLTAALVVQGILWLLAVGVVVLGAAAPRGVRPARAARFKARPTGEVSDFRLDATTAGDAATVDDSATAGDAAGDAKATPSEPLAGSQAKADPSGHEGHSRPTNLPPSRPGGPVQRVPAEPVYTPAYSVPADPTGQIALQLKGAEKSGADVKAPKAGQPGTASALAAGSPDADNPDADIPDADIPDAREDKK